MTFPCTLLHFSSNLLHFAAFYRQKTRNLLIILTNFDIAQNFFEGFFRNLMIIQEFL